MTQVEYLKASREENAAWLADFRARYGITQHVEEFSAPADSYEAHQHHAEFGGAAH